MREKGLSGEGAFGRRGFREKGAFGSRRTHREAQRLGAEILDKPFELHDLLERVRKIVPPDRYTAGWPRVG